MMRSCKCFPHASNINDEYDILWRSAILTKLHWDDLYIHEGRRGHDRMVVGFTTTYVCSNLYQGEVYNIMW